jgi:gluconate 5-dehydrogenase
MIGAPDFSLKEQVALVTGSAQGLGWAIAQAYAASGAHVIINGRNAERVHQRVQQLRQHGRQASPFVFDISQLQHQNEALKQVQDSTGPIGILVNNVGIRIRKSLQDASLTDIVTLIHTDLTAAIHLSKCVGAHMVEQGQGGRIITLTSIAGELARAGDAIYPVAKQGLAGLVRALAVEYGSYGITSNGIAPGTFATESNAALAADPIKGAIVVGRNPLARWAAPAEITGAAVFLASKSASYVNGHILVVDGGFSVTF